MPPGWREPLEALGSLTQRRLALRWVTDGPGTARSPVERRGFGETCREPEQPLGGLFTPPSVASPETSATCGEAPFPNSREERAPGKQTSCMTRAGPATFADRLFAPHRSGGLSGPQGPAESADRGGWGRPCHPSREAGRRCRPQSKLGLTPHGQVAGGFGSSAHALGPRGRLHPVRVRGLGVQPGVTRSVTSPRGGRCGQARPLGVTQ